MNVESWFKSSDGLRQRPLFYSEQPVPFCASLSNEPSSTQALNGGTAGLQQSYKLLARPHRIKCRLNLW